MSGPKTPLCDIHVEEGGYVDDLIVYKFKEESYLLVVNATNRHKDFKHLSNYILDNPTFCEVIGDIACDLAK